MRNQIVGVLTKTDWVMLKVIILLFGIVAVAGCVGKVEQVENRTPYTAPLASPGAKFGGLPPAAKNTIRAEVGSAEITDVIPLYNANSIPIYEIHFRNKDLLPPLFVAADGSILHPDLSLAVGAAADRFGVSTGNAASGLKPSDLPVEVSKVVRERTAGAAILNISKETWGDRVVYIVTFNDPDHHPRLYVAADGRVMNEEPK